MLQRHLLQKFNIVLPLTLALLLPLLSLLTDGVNPTDEDFFQKWVLSSLLIFSMWHSFAAINGGDRKYGSFKFIATLTFLLLLLVSLLYLYGFSQKYIFNWLLVVRILFTAFIIFIIQKVLSTQERLIDLTIDKEKLQTENFRIQLKSLRNQMDPHFFFNSLNTLRSLVRQNHANSEQFIIGLSDLYRQMLKFKEDVTVPLSKEIEITKSYFFILKNRNENALFIDFEDIDDAFKSYKIPTLALQSLVENCVKHNVGSKNSPLTVSIRTSNNSYIEVKNKIQPRFSSPETSGMGLELLQKRYKLLGFNDGIVITSTEQEFVVKLKLIPVS